MDSADKPEKSRSRRPPLNRCSSPCVARRSVTSASNSTKIRSTTSVDRARHLVRCSMWTDSTPVPGDPDGRVGEVLLPVVNVGTAVAQDFEMREDIGDPLLGLPRDLNGDAIIDTRDHREDAALLPVLVRVRWNGRNGPRQLDFFSALAEVTP